MMPATPPQSRPGHDQDSIWPAWYRRFVVGGLLLGTAMIAIGWPLGAASVEPRALAVVLIGVPAVTTLTVLVAHGRRSKYVLLASLLLDVEAVAGAGLFVVGLAYAVLLPVIGVGLLMGAVRGRTLNLALVVGGLSSVLGVALAFTIGPAAGVPRVGLPGLTVATLGVFVTYGLVHFKVFNDQRELAFEAARAEVAFRRRAEADLARTSGLLAAIVASSPVATGAVDAAGMAVLWNPAAERTFGWSGEEVLGAAPPIQLEATETQGERVRRTTKDGRALWVDIYSAGMNDADGNSLGTVGQLVDVGGQVSLESRLTRAAQLDRALAEGRAAFLKVSTETEVYDTLCRIGVESCGLRTAWVGLSEPGTARVRPHAVCGEQAYLAESGVLGTGVVPVNGVVTTALRTATAQIANDLGADADNARWVAAVRHGLMSVAAFPLMAGSIVRGVLQCYGGSAGFFGDAELAVLGQLAHDADSRVAAIEREQARREAEAALTSSEERYRGLFQTAPVGIMLMRGGEVDVNDTLLDMFGYTDRETLLTTGVAALVADGYAEDVESISRSLGPGDQSPVMLRTLGQRSDGSTFPLLAEGAQIEIDGGWTGIVYLTDLSAMEAAEEAAQAVRSRYQTLVDSAPLAVVSMDLDGMVRSWNPAAERMLGWSAGEVIGRQLPGGMTAEGRIELQRIAEQDGSATHAFETTRTHRDGSSVQMRVWISRLRNLSGDPDGALLVVEDVTSERRLNVERARLATAIEETADIVVITDLDARIVFVNPAFTRVTGYTRDEVLRKNPRILQSGRQGPEFYAGLWKCLAAGKTWTGELVNRKKDGSIYVEEASISPIRESIGGVSGYVAVKRDMTGLRRERAERIETEKRYRSLFENMHEGLAHCRMVYADGNPVDFIYLDVNAAFETQSGLRDVVGRRVSEVIPGIRETDATLFEIYGRVAAGGAPEHFTNYVAPLEKWTSISAYCPERGQFIAVVEDITDRVVAERALQAGNALLERAEKIAHIGSWRLNLATGRVDWSMELFAILGLDPAQIPSPDLMRASVHPDDLAGYESATAASLRDGAPPTLEYRVVRPDGSVRWVHGEGEQERDAAGRAVAFVGFVQDITERKAAEDALHAREAELHEAQRIGQTGSWVWDRRTGAGTWSDQMYRMYGLEPGSKPAGLRDIGSLFTPETAERLRAAVGQALEDGRPYELELEFIRPDATHGWTRQHGVPDAGPDGKVLTIHGTETDITEAKRRRDTMTARLRLAEFALSHGLDELLEETLNEAEALTGSAIGFYHFVDEDERHLTLHAWSTRTRHEFGKARGAGRHSAVADAGVWADCVRQRRPVIRNDNLSLTDRESAPDGQAAPVREVAVPVFRNGRIAAILGVGNKPVDYTEEDVEAVALLGDLAFDIAARMGTENELRQSEARYRAILEQAPIAIGAHRNGRGIFSNEAHVRLFGYGSPDEIANLVAADMLTPESLDDAAERMRRRNQGLETDSSYEIVGRRRDGSTFPALVKATPVDLPDGPATLLFHLDLTEIKRANEQLRQSQKLEAVGRLAGGIAHDFNNLLTAIGGYARILESDLANGSANPADASEIARAADRAAALTAKLLAFSGRQNGILVSLDLADAAGQIMPMLRRVVPERIDIETDLQPVPALLADPSDIDRVLLNLVVNAADAIATTGKISVGTATVTHDAAFLAAHAGSRAGEHARLIVADGGSGMDETTRAHIFEPFFTTKPAGQGTGLGLATVYGVVEGLGGWIEVRSELGAGTTFEIDFPASDLGGTSIAGHRNDITEGGSERVLLVEDEPMVRRFAAEALRRSGYLVTEVESPHAALEADRSSYDLVVTDVIMPGMGGGELIRKLRAGRPELPVLFVSGYSPSPAEELGLEQPRTALLAKPFTPDEIDRAIRKVLDGASGTQAVHCG